MKACWVVYRNIALIDALGKRRYQYGVHAVALKELIFIRLCISDRLHVWHDNRLVQRQKFTLARETLYGEILKHILLMSHTS